MSTLRTNTLKDLADTVSVDVVDIAATIVNAQTLREDLANSVDPAKGANLVGYNSSTVDTYIGDRVVLKVGATVADLTAAIATGREVVVPSGVTVTIDNSAAVGLTISAASVRISGKGSLVATSDAFDMLRANGANFLLTGVTLQGPGTYRPDLGGAGEPPALVRISGSDSTVQGCNFVDPFGAGVFVRAATGARVIDNNFTSAYAGSIAQPFLFHVFLRVASDTLVQGNTVVGSIQGICGGGDGSSTITVTGKDGLVTSNLRNTVIQANTCAKQLDHSIYISNDSVQTTIDNNQVSSTNDLIKIEGGPNIVTNNRGVGGSGITGRNVLNTLIDGNSLITTLSSANAYGILLFEQIFQRPLNDVTISNNILTCQGVTSAGGIYVIGDVWSGYQSVISNLKIIGNTLKGYGNLSEGVGIGVQQNLFPGSPVTGALSDGIVIANNVIEFPAHALPTYGIFLRNGLKSGSITGNVIKNFRSQGVRMLGVQDFEVSGNTFIGDPGASGLFGIFERAKDLTTHYNSQGNRYGNNVYRGTFSRFVSHSDETCYNSDRVVIRRTGGLSADTVNASQWPKQQVYNNHTAGAVITLDALSTAPWPIDSDITIINAAAANSLTVNPGGFAVPAGTSLRLVGIGSNAWIKAN